MWPPHPYWINSIGFPQAYIIDSLLPCDLYRHISNYMWTKTRLTPPGIRIRIELNPHGLQIHAFFIPSYLATPTGRIPMAIKHKLNWLQMVVIAYWIKPPGVQINASLNPPYRATPTKTVPTACDPQPNSLHLAFRSLAINSTRPPTPFIVVSILPCDPCRHGSNCIWIPTERIPLGFQILIELIPTGLHIHALLTPSYLDTPTAMNPSGPPDSILPCEP